jgi:hypothetical protein
MLQDRFLFGYFCDICFMMLIYDAQPLGGLLGMVAIMRQE